MDSFSKIQICIIYLPHVIPNLYEFLSYVEHKKRYFKNVGNLTLDCPHWLT